MSRIVCIIQARMTSTRLPGKVLLPIAGRPALEHLLLRAGVAFGVRQVVVALPHGAEQQPLRTYLERTPLCVAYAGPEADVWTRYVAGVGILKLAPDDWIVRLTGDCPWLPVEELLGVSIQCGQPSDPKPSFISNTLNVPPGWNVQAVRVDALLEIGTRDDLNAYHREHVVSLLDRPEMLLSLGSGPSPTVKQLPDGFRCTLDSPGDYAWFQSVAAEIDVTPPLHPTTEELLDLFRRRPDLIRTQGDYEREKAAADLRQ